MDIKNLSSTGLPSIVECLVEAFEGYFVQMPADVEYWKKRFRGARVDLQLSFGVFDKDRLVAFIINGVDVHKESLTAFNTGTGVLPAYRGEGLVDDLYNVAIPVFRDAGVRTCALEVIRDNERGIRVYERIGFERTRKMHCFKGELNLTKEQGLYLKKKNLPDVLTSGYEDEHFYSWDHSASSILASGDIYETYVLQNYRGQELGYFTIIEQTGYLARIEKSVAGDYEKLLNACGTISRNIKINNVDEKRRELIAHLEKAGLTNFIDQFQMEMAI